MFWLPHIYCTNVYNNNYFHQTPFIRFEDCTEYPKRFCLIFLNSSVLWYRYPCLIGQQNITRVRQEFRYFSKAHEQIKFHEMISNEKWLEWKRLKRKKCNRHPEMLVFFTKSIPPAAPSRAANINCKKSLVFFVFVFVFCRLYFLVCF